MEFISNTHNETIQNWIKRILNYMLKNNLLSDEEIYFLHDKEYSKLVFGIGLPFFVDSQRDTIVSGHTRYWQEPIGSYYVCKEWWKEKDKEYETKIYK